MASSDHTGATFGQAISLSGGGYSLTAKTRWLLSAGVRMGTVNGDTGHEHGPELPDWLDEPISAVRVGSYTDQAVTVLGFDRYSEGGTVLVKYELHGARYSDPISRFDFAWPATA